MKYSYIMPELKFLLQEEKIKMLPQKYFVATNILKIFITNILKDFHFVY